MKKFRPISLLNCSFKIFTKVLTNRFAKIIDRLISYQQSAFIKGRFILESVVSAHEIIHEVHHKKKKGLIFKIDYEKAYDRVNLDFLYEVLELRGFGPKIIAMIKQITQGGSVGVKINDTESDFFLTGKGLRQGDPFAPLLFNFVVDVFSRMLIKGCRANLIRGLCTDFVPGGVVSLQYADDTLLFLENDERVAINLKWILSCFEQLSGMKINYHKSGLLSINMSEEEMQPFLDVFQCTKGAFPMKYLGVPLHFNELRREDLQPLIDSLLKRMTGWRGKLLSTEAKRILIQTCLSSIPIYLLSFYKFPKWVLALINTQLANCMWSDEEGNRKIHLANWQSICMKKEYGSLGVPNLSDLNLCLLGSWVKRYIRGEGSLWKKIIDAKYNTKNPNILCCKELNPSIFWKGVMWATKAVQLGYRWQVGNGRSVRLWEDVWFGNSNLATQFWDLYFICNQQTMTIADLWDGDELKCMFRRTFTESLMIQWQELLSVVRSISLSEEDDQLLWKYESKGVYSSKSLYAIVNFRGIQPIYLPAVWDIKIPPRVQIFLWLLSQNKVMTTDNLRKRGMPKPLECCLCKEFESVTHLFFDCIVANQMWSTVQEVFGVEICDYYSLASKWLCGKRHLQLNVVSSAVLWSLWINRNNIVFNRKTWLNLKQVWHLILLHLRNWKVPFKHLEWPMVDKFMILLSSKLQSPLEIMPG